MMDPKVTVLVTTYNSNPDYLRSALESACSQGYSNKEVLVVDDGSKSDISKITNDFDVRLLTDFHKGFPHALHAGMIEARGEYVAVLDHDDVLTPDSVALRVEALQSSKAGFVYGDVHYIDDCGHKYYFQKAKQFKSDDHFLRTLILGPTVPLKHTSVLFSREAVLTSGNYDLAFTSLFDDKLLLSVGLRHGYRYIPECVVNYRIHENNASSHPAFRSDIIPKKCALIDEFVSDPFLRSSYKLLVSAIELSKKAYFSFTKQRPEWVFNVLRNQYSS